MASADWISISTSMLPALARIGGIVACAPLFSSSAVPRRMRAAIAVALTIGLAPAVKSTHGLSGGELMLAIGGELMIGVAIGLAMHLVIDAARWAGEMIAQQLGLGLAENYDGNAQTQVPTLANAYSLLTLVVFLGVNGHHALLRGISASFRSLPLMSAVSGHSLVAMLTGLLTSATQLALQLAAPVFVTVMIADLVVGMIGKSVPQMGMMTAEIAVRAAAGLGILILCAALTGSILQGASTAWMQTVQTVVGQLGK